MTAAHSTAALPVAALDRRFTAFVIDRAVAWGGAALLGLLAHLAGGGPWVVAATCLAALLVALVGLALTTGLAGTTPGKAALGLRVVHHHSGIPVGVGRALVRSLVVAVASVPTFGVGLATLAWTAVEDRGRRRRGWHDRVAGSVVIDVRPAPVTTESPTQAPRHIVNLTAMRLVPAPAPPARETPPRTAEPVHRRPPAAVPASAPPAAGEEEGRTVVRTPRAPAPPAPAVLEPDRAPPVWRIDFDTGESLLVDGPVLVGRRPEARSGERVAHLVNLSSADLSVSKTHAQVTVAEEGVLVVTDRGSTNGSTLVRQGAARQLAPGRPATLLDGDRVTFGDREMTVRRTDGRGLSGR